MLRGCCGAARRVLGAGLLGGRTLDDPALALCELGSDVHILCRVGHGIEGQLNGGGEEGGQQGAIEGGKGD